MTANDWNAMQCNGDLHNLHLETAIELSGGCRLLVSGDVSFEESNNEAEQHTPVPVEGFHFGASVVYFSTNSYFD